MLDASGVLAKMDAAGVDRIVMIPTMNDPLPETPERLLGALRKLMMNRAGRAVAEVVHRATLTAEGDLKLSGKVFTLYDRPDNASVARLVEAHPARFLYGTDAPYGFHDAEGSYDYGAIKGWVERLPISSAKREAVFGENFLALLGKANVKPA